ncbi:MAG: hypothetical protein WAT58_06510 [Candidatus Dormiibacterota bacterium]
MRRGVLRIAEIFGWMAGGFAFFLSARMFFIFLSIVNPAFCDISCDIGRYAVPVSIACFVIAWAPLPIIGMIHHARRSLSLAWAPHAIGLTIIFALAMLYVAAVSLSFRDVDSRNVILAGAAAITMVISTLLLFVAAIGDRTLPPTEAPVRFFQEDMGE